MSSSENGSAAPSGNPPAKSQPAARGFWALLGNAAAIGALGTALVGALQYISAYHDSVAKLAKEDLDAATTALTDTVTALSKPLSLQGRLIWNYSSAKKHNLDNNDDAYETKSARAISKDYEDSVTALSTDISLLARKMEIYFDLPDDLNHAAANNSAADSGPISADSLRASDFACDDKHMPFGRDESGKVISKLPIKLSGDSTRLLAVNWRSAKDNLLTLEYCFEITHEEMREIRLWASNNANGKLQPANPVTPTGGDDYLKKLKTLAKLQDQRFGDFMSVATFKIEQFRVRYQPNGLLCSVLGVDTALDHFAHVCTPHLIATE